MTTDPCNGPAVDRVERGPRSGCEQTRDDAGLAWRGRGAIVGARQSRSAVSLVICQATGGWSALKIDLQCNRLGLTRR
jgi:hypothetical protein